MVPTRHAEFGVNGEPVRCSDVRFEPVDSLIPSWSVQRLQTQLANVQSLTLHARTVVRWHGPLDELRGPTQLLLGCAEVDQQRLVDPR